MTVYTRISEAALFRRIGFALGKCSAASHVTCRFGDNVPFVCCWQLSFIPLQSRILLVVHNERGKQTLNASSVTPGSLSLIAVILLNDFSQVFFTVVVKCFIAALDFTVKSSIIKGKDFYSNQHYSEMDFPAFREFILLGIFNLIHVIGWGLPILFFKGFFF